MSAPITSGTPTVAAPRPAPTVLVVEDEDNLRAVIRRLLQGEGYGVLEAGNGASALQLLDMPDHQVELVLTDLRMPVMDGRQLAGTTTSSPR